MGWLGLRSMILGGWLIVLAAAGWQFRPRRTRPIVGASSSPTTTKSEASDGRQGPLPHPLVLAVIVGLAVLDVRVSILIAVIAVGRPIVQRRRQERHREAHIVAELPHIADFFLVALSGGLTIPLAVRVVADRLDGLFAVALGEVIVRTQHGARLADELEALPDQLGDGTRPLIRLLVAAERYGSSAIDGLEQVARDVRLDRRRRAETAARRLPITLLFPLVLCTLPAFVLLTVVPIIVSSLDGVLR